MKVVALVAAVVKYLTDAVKRLLYVVKALKDVAKGFSVVFARGFSLDAAKGLLKDVVKPLEGKPLDHVLNYYVMFVAYAVVNKVN